MPYFNMMAVRAHAYARFHLHCFLSLLAGVKWLVVANTGSVRRNLETLFYVVAYAVVTLNYVDRCSAPSHRSELFSRSASATSSPISPK